MTQEHFANLLDRVQTLQDLGGAAGLLGWDERTYMPDRGAAVRAERLATLTKIIHGMSTSPEMGDLIDRAEEYARKQGDDSFEFAIWRLTQRRYEKTKVVPVELSTEFQRARSLAAQAWRRARADKDYNAFKPFLKRNLELGAQVMDHRRSIFPDVNEDYDIALDDFEEGLSAAEISRVFDDFKAGAASMVQKVAEHSVEEREARLHGKFPAKSQEALVRNVVERLGFTDDAWNLAETTHPFESSMAINDIRITTKYPEDFFNPSFFGTIHEFGHGIYEHQIDEKYERTPIARGVSMSWHESQSRMWENIVGRSRAFWTWATPLVNEAFPDQLGDATPDEMFRSVNAMGSSLIRIEADELTYNFHIILRYELEREMLSGDVTVDNLPEAWNTKIKDYLGLDVPSDDLGVLQDVHWSSGMLGYFPTYALGNVLGAQLWEKILSAHPNIEDEFAQGEFGTLREWSRENIHQYGSLYTPQELMIRVLGTDRLEAQPLINYLNRKVDALYG